MSSSALFLTLPVLVHDHVLQAEPWPTGKAFSHPHAILAGHTSLHTVFYPQLVLCYQVSVFLLSNLHFSTPFFLISPTHSLSRGIHSLTSHPHMSLLSHIHAPAPGTCYFPVLLSSMFISSVFFSLLLFPFSDHAFDLYFATNSKGGQLTRNRSSCAYLCLPEQISGVCVAGSLEVVSDSACKSALWQPEWTRYYSGRCWSIMAHSSSLCFVSLSVFICMSGVSVFVFKCPYVCA